MKKEKISFSPQLESEFRLTQTRRRQDLFLPTTVSLTAVSLIAQFLNFKGFQLLPGLFVMPMILMGLFYKKIRTAPGIDFFLNALILLTGLSFIYLIVLFPDKPHNFFLLSFLILAGFLLFKMGYRTAGVTGTVLIFFYATASALKGGASVDLVVSNSVFLIILSAIGMAAGYTIEYNSRSVFLHHIALDRLTQLNRHEEKRQSREIGRIHKSLELEMRAHIEAEAQLKESENKYRDLISSLPEGVLIVRDGKIVFSNSTFGQLTGFDAKQIENMDFGHIFSDSPHMDSDSGYQICEKITHKDGRQIHIEKTMVPISFRQEPAQLFTVSDITEKVQAEQERTRLEQELSKARKMEALGLLAGGVAHDLNNVLAGLVSTPDFLLADLPENSDLRPHIEIIKKSGNRAAGIVDDLLTLARGGKKISEPVHLNHVVEDYFESPEFERLAKEYEKVLIEKILDPEVSFISGSGMQIRKIVMNLVSNAIEAVGNRTGTVVVETGWLGAGPAHLKDRDCLRFSVSDSGEGIESKDIERIFDPFYSRKIAGRSGTGLGLSIVWNAVHDHNGHIEVESRDRKTRFDVYLPVTPVSAPEQQDLMTLDDFSGSGEKILIVEDMETQRKITYNMIRRLGYHPVAVSSGETAVAAARSEKFDLVVLDMILDNGMNGYQTYQHLLTVDPQLKAVITSGYAVTRDVTSSQKLGAGSYVKKPFTLEQIGLAIKKELAV